MSDNPISDKPPQSRSVRTSQSTTSSSRAFRSLLPQASSWRLVLDTALDAVVVMDGDGKIVDWNDNARDIFGWTAEEALGRGLAELIIPPQLRQAHVRGLRRYLKTGRAKILGRRIEIFGLRRSGEEFPVELSISPISEKDGLVFVGFLRDISERRNAERLREQHALKMEALYHAVSFAAESSSFEDALQVCLASFQKLTGWPLGHVYLPSETEPVRLLPSPIWFSTAPEKFGNHRAVTEETILAPGEGLPGQVWTTREPIWIVDVDTHSNFPRARGLGGDEIKSALGFPIRSGDQVIAVIEFFSEIRTTPDPELLLTLRAIGEQVGRVFERRRAEHAVREHASALEIEVAERKRAEEHQKLLLAEINHRVKNMLAVVTAIASQTARNSNSAEAFNQSFLSRLQALSRSHSLLTAGDWKTISLRDLVDAILSPHVADHRRLAIRGPAVGLTPKIALVVGMILHELVTNAIKYGALSHGKGMLTLEWQIDSVPRPRLRLVWSETGVGPTSRPKRTGFGSAMIEASVQHELKGRARATYGDDGLRYDLEFPLK